MTRILLTAFEPYDQWSENSSWLTLVDLTSWLDSRATIVTRRYPVDFETASDRLRRDLAEHYDFAIHLGQAPGSPVVKLESTGLNLRVDHRPLVDRAPAAYRSPLPLERLRANLGNEGIPAEVSHHAGVYLCNAVLYLSQHYANSMRLGTRAMFMHLPLAPHQVAKANASWPSCDVRLMARAVATAIDWLENTSADPLADPWSLDQV